MRNTTSLIRRIYAFQIESRERRAQRAVDDYLKHRPLESGGPLERFTGR